MRCPRCGYNISDFTVSPGSYSVYANSSPSWAIGHYHSGEPIMVTEASFGKETIEIETPKLEVGFDSEAEFKKLEKKYGGKK